MAFVAGAAAAVLVVHVAMFGLTSLRDKVWSRRYFDPESELLDGPPMHEVSEKVTGLRSVSFKRS